MISDKSPPEEAFKRVVGVSPAVRLVQKLKDLERQREAGVMPEVPQHAGRCRRFTM
jgi:hypothetical protein